MPGTPYVRRKPADVRIEPQRATTSRSMRSPRYDCLATGLEMGALLPIAYAPVLAGDTLKSSSMMARLLSVPVAGNAINAVRGAWWESWLFYVRVGDLASAEAIRSSIIQPGVGAATAWRNEINAAVWTAYFADETPQSTTPLPAWNPAGYNKLRIPGNGWWDSITPNSQLPSVAPAAGDEWQEQWIRYQALRRARLTTSTWEEYLAKHGVSVGPQIRAESDPEGKIPELLQWSREYAYPQPAGFSDTAPTTEMFRVQWFIQNKLERGRFFAEPGFLVSYVAVRPKMYRFSSFDPLTLLDEAEGWMPIDFDTDPHASLVSIDADALGDTVPGNEVTIDQRDLYLYGDQMIIGVTGLANGVTNLTQTDRYPSGSVGTFNMDATISHRIASRVAVDTTAG